MLEIAEGLEKDLDQKKAEMAKMRQINDGHLNELRATVRGLEEEN